jgi:hypothetical protein
VSLAAEICSRLNEKQAESLRLAGLGFDRAMPGGKNRSELPIGWPGAFFCRIPGRGNDIT